MSHSRFLSSISLALLLAACGDDHCGIGDAPDDGLNASSADVTITYTNLTAGANNDCPASDAPPGVTSLTIMGVQTNGAAGLFTACVPRPDELGTAAPIGTSLTSAFQLVDLSGTDANNCTYELDRTRPPTGTAQGINVCANGTDKTGFILTMHGAVSFIQKCGTMPQTDVAVIIDGRVAVHAN
jgi:hypothetical protein